MTNNFPPQTKKKRDIRLVSVLAIALCFGTAWVAHAASASPPAEIAIENFQFSPKNITIKKGTTIVWTNHDNGSPHGISSEKAKFESPLLGGDDNFSWTFNEAGTFPYSCSQHGNMLGTVTVTEK